MKNKKEDKKKHCRTFEEFEFNRLYKKIKEYRGLDGKISYFDLNFVIAVTFAIPKDIRHRIIAELIDVDVLKAEKIGHTYYYKVL